MKKAIILLIAAICCSLTVGSAQKAAKLLAPSDSVFMFVHENEQKILMHPVKKGQTLYSISQFYGISVDELKAYNPWYKGDQTIEVKDKVLIPIPNKAINRYVKRDKLKKYTPLFYVVQKGDNLYHICTRHFSMSVDEVKKRNQLKNETLELGQLLQVGWIPIAGIPKAWRTAPVADPKAKPDQMAKGGTTPPVKVKPLEKSMKATWVKDAKTVSGHFCLTNEAPKNSKIKVCNAKTKKEIEVTVVGKLATVKDPGIKIILSEQAATALDLTEKDAMVIIKP
jgi:LysM repeat protein